MSDSASDFGVLCPQPGKDVRALAAGWPGPAQVLQRFTLLPGPPIFLNHHQRPTAAARSRNVKISMASPCLGPMALCRSRSNSTPSCVQCDRFRPRIGQAYQQVEKPKERWLGEILHGARSFEEEATRVRFGIVWKCRAHVVLPPLHVTRQESSAQWAFGGGPHPRRSSFRYNVAAPSRQADLTTSTPVIQNEEETEGD